MYRASYNNGDGEVFFYDDSYPLNEFRILDPTVNLKDSEAASFTVTLPPTNVAYSEIEKFTTEITVYEGDEELFDGRVVADNRDFYNNRALTCEGGLAYLIDTSQPQMEYHDITLRQFIEALFSHHNAKVADDKKFYVGYVSPNLLAENEGDIYLSYRATQFESTLEALNKVVSDYGGHIKYERVIQNGTKQRTVSILADSNFDTNTSQTINFGQNLLDFTQGYDMSDLCTVLVATGQRETSPDANVPGDNLVYYTDTLNPMIPESKTTERYNALSEQAKLNGHYLLADTAYGPTQQEQFLVRMYHGNIIYTARANKAIYIVESGDQQELVIDNNSPGYYLSDLIKVDAGSTYFVSYRLNKNVSKKYVGYAIKDIDGTVLEYKALSQIGELGVEDAIQVAVTIPAGGVYLYVCGIGRDIPIQCQPSKENLEKLDTYLTMEGAKGIAIIPDDPDVEQIDITRANYDQLPDYEKEDTNKWYYITDEDKIYHTNRLFKDGIYLINPYTLEQYGWIEKKAGWDDITDSEELLLYAYTYLFSGQWDKVTINLTAFDMRMLGVTNVMPYRLYQRAWVKSEPHGLNMDFPVTELSIPLLNPESTQFTLGYESDQTFTSATNSANTDILKQIFSAPSMSETLQDAMNNAAALINMATSGHIQIVQNQYGADELLIHDGPEGDYHMARHMWRWNMHGLKYGFVPDGSAVTYDAAYNAAGTSVNVAITMDGAISANFITAGIMSADRMRGGELILGNYNSSGSPSTPGKLTVYNSDGYYLFKVGDESNPTASARGVSAQSTPFTYDGVTVRDIIQMHKGHLYLYMTEKTGSYQQEQEHANAIANIFMSRDSQWSSAEGCALIFFAPNFHFMKDPHSAGTATTKFDTNVDIVGNTTISGTASIGGNATITGSASIGGNTSIGGDITIKGHSTYSNSNGVSGADHIFKFDQGICIGVETNTNVPYWTNGSNEINIGGTTLNKSDLDALLALIHPQQNPDQNGGA